MPAVDALHSDAAGAAEHRAPDRPVEIPAIEFEDGTWHRDDSKEMVQTIRAGRLDEKHGVTPASASAA